MPQNLAFPTKALNFDFHFIHVTSLIWTLFFPDEAMMWQLIETTAGLKSNIRQKKVHRHEEEIKRNRNINQKVKLKRRDRTFLDVVIGEGSSILELLRREDQALLIRRNP